MSTDRVKRACHRCGGDGYQPPLEPGDPPDA